MAVSLTLAQWHPGTDCCGNGYTDWSPNLAPITDSSCDSKHVAALLWPQSSYIRNGRVNQMLFTSLLYHMLTPCISLPSGEAWGNTHYALLLAIGVRSFDQLITMCSTQYTSPTHTSHTHTTHTSIFTTPWSVSTSVPPLHGLGSSVFIFTYKGRFWNRLQMGKLREKEEATSMPMNS